MLSQYKIKTKLYAGFFLMIFVFAALAAYQLTSLNSLNNLQQEVFQRGEDSRKLKDIVSRIQAIYAVIGDSVINRKLDETKADLKELKSQAVLDSKTVLELVDTEGERKDASLFGAQLERYLRVFEEELIPLIEQDADGNMSQIQAVDGRLDEIRDEVLAPLARIDVSLIGETEEADEKFDTLAITLETTTMIVVVVALLLASVIAFVISRAIVTPLTEMVVIANRLAEGDMTVTVDVQGKDETAQVKQALSNMINRLKSVVSEISTASMSLQSASEQVSSTANSLSQGSAEQAASVEETSASMEQMNATVQQNADNSKATENIATTASGKAKEGGIAVRRTVDAMTEIASKITLIEDIAYKTNLLALNAAIEAARAGEHGKGFAVVADEVRKLAERSQTSAQEINTLASDSVKVATQAGALVEELVPDIQKTSDLVQEISAASDEQTSGIEQVKTAIEQLDKLSQLNASSSEELAATAEEMSSQSGMLLETVGFFTIDEYNLAK